MWLQMREKSVIPRLTPKLKTWVPQVGTALNGREDWKIGEILPFQALNTLIQWTVVHHTSLFSSQIIINLLNLHPRSVDHLFDSTRNQNKSDKEPSILVFSWYQVLGMNKDSLSIQNYPSSSLKKWKDVDGCAKSMWIVQSNSPPWKKISFGFGQKDCYPLNANFATTLFLFLSLENVKPNRVLQFVLECTAFVWLPHSPSSGKCGRGVEKKTNPNRCLFRGRRPMWVTAFWMRGGGVHRCMQSKRSISSPCVELTSLPTQLENPGWLNQLLSCHGWLSFRQGNGQRVGERGRWWRSSYLLKSSQATNDLWYWYEQCVTDYTHVQTHTLQ